MKWFYIDTSITDGDRRQGPYTIDEIKNFVNEGKIKDETLVWHTGQPDWKCWKDLANESESTEEQTEELSEEDILKQTIETLLKSKMQSKRFAGFFVRANAFIIDNLILTIAGVICLYLLNFLGFVDLNAVSEIAKQYIDNPTSEIVSKALELPGMYQFFVIWSIIQAAYFIIFHAVSGATPGKKLFHIHVEMANGEKLSWGFSIFRFIASIVTQATLIFYGLGYLIVLVDIQKRALHDHIARTRVVHDGVKQNEKTEV